MKIFMKKVETFLNVGGTVKEIILLAISGISLLLSIFHIFDLSFDLAWIAIILCGIPIILEAVIGLVTEFDIKADVLVSMALIAAVFIGEDFAAGEVAFIMQLGALLEDITVERARAGIEKLVHLTPQTARVIKNGSEKIISAQQVAVDDILRVLPGETIPVDGIVLSGKTSVNEAVMTGESLPVDKSEGDEVSSGTVNQFGPFEMKAVKVGEDSSIQRMIRLVQSADAGKAEIVGIADRWATWIVVVALAAAGFTWLVSEELIRAVTILVVFCPCALVLATPTAIMAAIGNATKHGFLVREGDALERLASVSEVTFDKTGTLTYGTPEVTAVRSFLSQYSYEDIYGFCASAEKLSEHPLGKAVVRCYINEMGKVPEQPDEFRMIPGRGVSCVIKGKKLLAGNEAMMKDNNILFSKVQKAAVNMFSNRGCTSIYVASDGEPAGYLALSDTVRSESPDMIKSLISLKIRPVLLTGDHKSAAVSIAERLNIKEVYAECFPEDKLGMIEQYQEQGKKICMIGDGINDAPALKKADVGIAMGEVGSDIAVDAADIVLIDDEIKELPHLPALSKRMMATIKCNMSFSMILNFIAVILAITGILTPVIGALVHNAGSIIVIVNSAILLNWRSKIKV